MKHKIYRALKLCLECAGVSDNQKSVISGTFDQCLDKIFSSEPLTMIDLYIQDCDFQIRELANDMAFETDAEARKVTRDQIIRQQTLARIYKKYQERFPMEDFSWANATNSGLVEPWEGRIINAPPEERELDITQEEIGQPDS